MDIVIRLICQNRINKFIIFGRANVQKFKSKLKSMLIMAKLGI